MESIPVFSKEINQYQAKDTGMAMILICLLVAYFGGIKGCYLAVIILLILNMIWPRILTPIVYFWFGLSKILGAIVSSSLCLLPERLTRCLTGLSFLVSATASQRVSIWQK